MQTLLKITKTRLRNKMEYEYLTNNFLMQIGGEFLDKHSYDDIIDDLKKQKSRQVYL